MSMRPRAVARRSATTSAWVTQRRCSGSLRRMRPESSSRRELSSATVVAMEEAEVLEIRRNVLYLLQRNRSSREMLDRVYRQRALANHLQGVALFAGLPEGERKACTDYLRDKVELVRVDPGQIIFQQGEPADHFYLIRLGFVKVSRSYAGQERAEVSPGLGV